LETELFSLLDRKSRNVVMQEIFAGSKLGRPAPHGAWAMKTAGV